MIRASKILVVLYYIVPFFIISLMTVMIWRLNFPSVEILVICFTISLCCATFCAFITNYDIEIDKDRLSICGPETKINKRVPLIDKVRARILVKKSNIDKIVAYTNSNKLVDKYFKINTVFNLDGQCLIIYQSFFLKKDINNIKTILKETFEVEM